MAKKKKQRVGVCHNPACPMCDIEQFFDEGQEFKCKCCPESLEEIGIGDDGTGQGHTRKPHPRILIYIIGVALVLIAAIVWFFVSREHKSIPIELTLNNENITLCVGESDCIDANIKSEAPIETITTIYQSNNPLVVEVNDDGVIKAIGIGADTIIVIATAPNCIADTAIVRVIVNDINVVIPEKNNLSRDGYTEAKIGKHYPIGKYEGKLINGIPEGDGKFYYTCHVQIAKHDTDNPPHYAEAGDWFDGTWGNGDIISGALYSKDGKIKEKILAPKRFNPYDLNKERCL